MSELSLPLIDKTIHKTRLWLDDVMAVLETTDRAKAFRALRSVLHALRDELQVEEAVRFGAQMPLLIRGLYYEGWKPSSPIGRFATVDGFLAAVAHEFGDYPTLELERIVRGVYRVVAAHISDGEMRDVTEGLSREVREFLTVECYRSPGEPLLADPAGDPRSHEKRNASISSRRPSASRRPSSTR